MVISTMKMFWAILATIALASVADGFERGLRVKFNVGLNPGAGESFFYEVPLNVTAATTEGWKVARRPIGPLPQLTMYCPSDKVLCGLFDDTGYIAGVQVALAKTEFSNNQFDMIKQGFTSWNTSVDNQCKTFWTLQQYFVDEEFLSISSEERLANRNSSRTLQAGGVWLTGFDRQLTKVPDQETAIEEQALFTKQACIWWMGQHYYYNMSETTECTSDQIYPWFPMVGEGGELIASGFMTFGELELIDGMRDWFERPPQLVVQAIVPSGPECLYSMAGDVGALTMHIYYVNNPWSILCT